MPRKAGAEKETQSSRLPTFQERLRRGSSIRGVKKLTLEELERLAQVMNERSGSCICVSEEVYRELEYGLRLVSGAVEDMAPITRKDFDTRLERLQNALAIAAQVLEPARLNAWVETTDSEFIFFLAEVVGRDGGVKEGLSLSQTHLRLLEAVRVHCARAGITLAEMPAKTGRRSLWAVCTTDGSNRRPTRNPGEHGPRPARRQFGHAVHVLCPRGRAFPPARCMVEQLDRVCEENRARLQQLRDSATKLVEILTSFVACTQASFCVAPIHGNPPRKEDVQRDDQSRHSPDDH